jgi:hypothetical protein
MKTSSTALALGSKLALVATLACGGACAASPKPVEATVEFQTERGVVRGVSTEDGIFALAEVVPTSGELRFRCHTGNSFFDDVATLARRDDALAVFSAKSSRPNLARFGSHPASRDDALFLETRTKEGAGLLRCHVLGDGTRGDLLVVEGDVADVARRYAGSGLFAWRDGAMELVGMLNGVYCDEPATVAFVGLDAMSTLIPETSSYFTRRSLPRRQDFEYGVPRDFDNEKRSVSDPPRADDEPTKSEPPSKTDPTKPVRETTRTGQ